MTTREIIAAVAKRNKIGVEARTQARETPFQQSSPVVVEKIA